MMVVKVWRSFWNFVYLGAPFVSVWLFYMDQPIMGLLVLAIGLIAG